MGTGDSEDSDPFPEEALGTDINDQGRRHRAAAAMQADRRKPSRLQASKDMNNPLFWWQQVICIHEQASLANMVACCYLKSENIHHLAAACIGRIIPQFTSPLTAGSDVCMHIHHI